MARARVAFVIMAGGRGERLWPLVRETMPKVCLRPDGEQSLLDMTLERLKPWARPHNTLIVTTKEQAPLIRKTLPRAFHKTVLAEPQPKNTAACVALAASMLAARHQDAIMSVLPADHWIPDARAFGQSLQAAIEIAQSHPAMIMLGVQPSRVHPGLGHLCVGASLGRRHGCQIFRLARFIEKPTPTAARSLMRRNRVFWNAGIFVGQTAVFRELIQRWLPQHARHLFPLGGRAGKADFPRAAASAYRALQAISFDDGVMAHLRSGFIVESRFIWEDLGSWESWMRIHRLTSPTVAVDSPNVHVLAVNGAGKHLIATVGLRDVIVIHTPEATLICHASRTQAVRTVVAQLAGDPELSQHA